MRRAPSAPADFACRVRATASSVALDPVPARTGTLRGGLDDDLHDAAVLVVRKRGRFARRPARHDPVRPGGDLEFHEGPEGFLVDSPVLEGRHNGDVGARKAWTHSQASRMISPLHTIRASPSRSMSPNVPFERAKWTLRPMPPGR